MHQTGALLTGIAESAIDDGEAENLARALVDVLKHRKVKLDRETLAWGNFLSVAGAVYLPRIIAVLAKRRAAQTNSRGTVHSDRPIIVADLDATGNLKPQVPN